ncbi:MAG: AlpA family phage regulatory protein [Phenylobacterium sp.]|jgi:predicted DNA-binding transcriptional regulator AlpA|uniref:helix-turn-helix transcriptional regulator n=1 Tax=Phenylobacterium sp. TaxID=1871053 RepID=UPI002A360B44|nr:AlpA family phage regulatory protein [Phenylobacterium sp.]MDX9998093.1 AlpA family phage regulatory protein [Phenylobacterium sp.]
MTSSTNKKLLAWITVRLMVGNLGRTTWWRLIRAEQAPRPIRISPGRVAWLESEILEWIDERRGGRS